jgi:hypothetical protein
MFTSRSISHSRGRLSGFSIRRQSTLSAVVLILAAGWSGAAVAQSTNQGRYFPLDRTAPPGLAGRWAGYQPGFVPAMQPVRVEIAGQGGNVSFYQGPDAREVSCAAPAFVALRVGLVYRLRISDLADYPGVELYPTVELIDRLHPPRGRELEFPVPIILTAEEIDSALDGRMVTKVVYLEQPDRAAPVRSPTAARTRPVQPRENVLEMADEAGRPMAIIRLGGRIPDDGALEMGFFGSGAPIQVFDQPVPLREAKRR